MLFRKYIDPLDLIGVDRLTCVQVQGLGEKGIVPAGNQPGEPAKIVTIRDWDCIGIRTRGAGRRLPVEWKRRQPIIAARRDRK